jgi:holo-[acyl-carrier protein] synthase
LTIQMASQRSLERVARHIENVFVSWPQAGNVVAVGIDLTDIRAVRGSIEHFGAQYLDRLFTPGERAQCAESSDPAPHLAARFAAKEATIKALMIDGHIPRWTCIEVQQEASGRCRIHLTGSAAQIARDKGVDALLVSLSHEADMAVAIVVATTSN